MLEGGQKPSYLGQSLTNGLTNEIANIGSQTFTMNIGDWILLKNRLIFSSIFLAEWNNEIKFVDEQ